MSSATDDGRRPSGGPSGGRAGPATGVARHHQALTELAFAHYYLRHHADDARDRWRLERLRAMIRRGRLTLAAERVGSGW